MNAVVSEGPWPSVVWDAHLVRLVDARGRREIEAAGRLRTLRSGDVLFRRGDPADVLFVVVEGRIALRGGGDAGRTVREIGPKEVLGEEALLGSFSERSLEARCEARVVVADVPIGVLKRAIVRAGGAGALMKIERTLRRASTLDLLRSAPFTRALGEPVIETLLDAARYVVLERNEHLYREGDEGSEVHLVHSGMIRVQSNEGGRPRIEAYLGRGDLVGEGDLGTKRAFSVVASGEAVVVAITGDVFAPIARRHPELLERARRVRVARMPKLPPNATAHVFEDLYRLRVARSLLVIGQDTCTRCGHCAWSCAATHEDGVSRLVRHGAAGQIASSSAPILVPNSCQHCQSPSCMIGCPTGAIGRDAKGDVFITEDLCTGCGSCAKACPWDNIQIAARPSGATYPAVAVKCDLCGDRVEGPACVAACPAQAIARIDPNVIVPESRPKEALVPRPMPSWPAVVGALLFGAAVALVPFGSWTSGILSGAVLACLFGYAGYKRIGLRSRARHRLDVLLLEVSRGAPTARLLYIAHLALGALVLGTVFNHVGLHAGRTGSAAALTITLALALVTGAFGALVSAVLPRALSRLERKSVLPEELGGELRRLEDALFAALSGKSEVVKALVRAVILPYHRSRLGGVALVVRRRSARAEERALRGRLDALVEGRAGPAMDGVDEIVRLVVEHRALRAQRMLLALLRGWLLPHVAASALVLVLLVVHVIGVGMAWSSPPRVQTTSTRR